MPLLSQLTDSTSEPVLTQAVTSNPLIEPLDGPRTVDSVMDRFPEEVYQKGRDTHLYRFLTALCGDAGAALLKKQAFVARLSTEAEVVSFQDLDNFYTSHFRFKRLPNETYTANANTDALTPEEWDDLALRDQSYRQRMLDFYNATRLGNTPDGMALGAKAGAGVPVDQVEHYRYIFDQYSDDKLGLTPYGKTISTSEGVIIPRVLDSVGAGDPAFTFTTTRRRVATFTPPVIPTASRPITAPTSPLTVALTWSTVSQARLLPEYERNMVDILDRIGPVGAFASMFEESLATNDLGILSVFASSERMHLSRFVQGRGDVSWPDVAKAGNNFIVAGVETQAGTTYAGARELPVVFHTPESVRAYTEKGVHDPTYNTGAFFDTSSGMAPYYNYRSEQAGGFLPLLVSVYPFLANIPDYETFGAERATAIQDTPLLLEGGA